MPEWIKNIALLLSVSGLAAMGYVLYLVPRCIEHFEDDRNVWDWNILAVILALYAAAPDNRDLYIDVLGVFIPLAVASWHDLEDMHVYDVVVFSALPFAVMLGWRLFGAESILYGCAAGEIFYFITRLSSGRLGEGDILPAGIIGAITGPENVYIALGSAGVLGMMYAFIRRQSSIPFLPFLSIGGIIGLAVL